MIMLLNKHQYLIDQVAANPKLVILCFATNTKTWEYAQKPLIWDQNCDYMIMIDIYKLDDFTAAYIECALWSSVDNEDRPLDDNYGISDLSQCTLEKMVDDCKDFQEANKKLLSEAYKLYSINGYTGEQMAGHDFWLTRNGHGTGFWDRDLGSIGDELTTASEVYKGVDLYVGDYGLIYC